jgi:hypothetical protein
MYKPPYLQKYAGKATRFTCPACKTPHSFTLYLDGETHQPIHPTVGRCNREIKCGYHYTPRQYYADLRNQNLPLPNNHPQGTSHPDTPSPITHHHKAPQHDLHFPITHHHGDSQSNPNASSQPVSTHAPSKTASHSNFPQPQSQPQPTQTHKEQSTGSHPQHPYSALTEIVSQPQPQSKFQFQPQFQPQKPCAHGCQSFCPTSQRTISRPRFQSPASISRTDRNNSSTSASVPTSIPTSETSRLHSPQIPETLPLPQLQLRTVPPQIFHRRTNCRSSQQLPAGSHKKQRSDFLAGRYPREHPHRKDHAIQPTDRQAPKNRIWWNQLGTSQAEKIQPLIHPLQPLSVLFWRAPPSPVSRQARRNR